jgi:hypothetical protein
MFHSRAQWSGEQLHLDLQRIATLLPVRRKHGPTVFERDRRNPQ